MRVLTGTPLQKQNCSCIGNTQSRSVINIQKLNCDRGIVPHASKGFGAAPAKPKAVKQAPKLQQQIELTSDAPQSDEEVPLLPAYRVYTEAKYTSQRFIGDVQIANTEGSGRGLVANNNLSTGTLVASLPALAFVEGDFQSVPEDEDLHVSMIEDGLPPATRAVLDMLYDGTDASQTKSASLTTLDYKFWASRGKDLSAPTVDSDRLMSIIQHSACSGVAQDAAVMQVRHQKPVGYLGIWPEFSFLNHSCVPNTSTVVAQTTMLMHATCDVHKGEQLTRNYIGAGVVAPVSVRQQKLQETFGFQCRCPRCQLEESVSSDIQEALLDMYTWRHEEAQPVFELAAQTEDLAAVKELYDIGNDLLDGLEQQLEASELTDMQKNWLRASAFECYDLQSTLCEATQGLPDPVYVRQCLDLVQVFDAGSENHTGVSIKYDLIISRTIENQMNEIKKRKQTRQRIPRALLRDQETLHELADDAQAQYLTAFIARYGRVSLPIITQLAQGLALYEQAVETYEMQKDGQAGTETMLEIDGIPISVIDKLESDVSKDGAVGGNDRLRVQLVSDEETAAM